METTWNDNDCCLDINIGPKVVDSTFRDIFRPFGEREREPLIEESKNLLCVCSKRLCLCCSGRDTLFIFSMIVNLAFTLNICPLFWKYLSDGGQSPLHISFWWVFFLKFILYSALSIYWECIFYIYIYIYIGLLVIWNVYNMDKSTHKYIGQFLFVFDILIYS